MVWEDKTYVGISLEWNYKDRTLHTSVPGFVERSLVKYQQPKPAKPQHAQAKAEPIQYVGRNKQSKPKDTTQQLTPAGIKKVQGVVGTFGWYARATDPTMEKL